GPLEKTVRLESLTYERPHGSQSRFGLPNVSPGRAEALPEGLALRKPQVRHRTPRRAAGHAHPPRQAVRVRRPSPREAEAEAVLRRAREPISPLLRAGVSLPGEHRRSTPQ